MWKGGSARGLTPAFVRHRIAAAEADPLSVARVEHDFRLLADDPAIRTVNADLRPGQHPGEASMVVTVDPAQRIDLYTGVANSRSPSVGGVRVSAGGSVRNAVAAGDVVSAEFGSTKGLTDFVAAYATDPLTQGVAVQLRGGFDNAAVIDRPLVPLAIRSREWSIEGGLSKALLARPLSPLDAAGRWQAAQSLTLGVLVAHRHLESRLLGEPFPFDPGSDRGRTEYSAWRLTADYTRRSVASVLAVSLTGSVGLGGTRPDDRTVPHPSTGFVAAVAQVNYARRLTRHQLELRLRVAGQGSGGLLYSSERFSIGGADTVRGYRENLLLADEALVGSIELAQPVELFGRRATGSGVGLFTFSAFADAALAHNRAVPQPLPDDIESIGVSAVWSPTNWLYARATYAHALHHVDAPGQRDLQDRGFEFKLVVHPLSLFREAAGHAV